MFTAHVLDIDTDNIADKVFRLQQYWVPRSDEFPFYTLGRCSYLDGKTPAYHEEIKTLNPILLKNFDNTYQIIIDYLSDQFKEPIELNSSLAHPSFHIFISDPFLLTHAGIWHQDIPHTTLGLDPIDPHSFTVAIKLPTGGAGIDYIENELQKYMPYVEKGIINQDGKVLHRISSLKEYIPDEYRITMQGHLIRINGVLTMFW
jgi:hypothetical protein